MRTRRVAVLALAFVSAACIAQVAAPRSAPPAPSASPALSRVPDAIYVRQSGNGTGTSITRIDVASGSVQGALPDGILAPDRSTLYWIESVDGATRTRIHELDVATGEERRAFTVDGDWIAPSSYDHPFGVSAEGRWMVLGRRVVQLNGSWISGFAVIDLRSGGVKATARVEGATTDLVTAIAPHGDAVVVTQLGDGPGRVKIWDVAAGRYLPAPSSTPDAWDGLEAGFVTGPAHSRDGTRLYFLDTGGASSGPSLRVVDLGTRRLSQVELPAAQRTTDHEKFLLWTLALSKDGSTVYAANAALGYVDEIDARSLALRRSAQLEVSAVERGPLARLRQALLPVADAKRFIRGGALLSSDGRRLYVPGTHGIAVVDVGALRLAAVWAKDGTFDGMALSPDGERLYAIDDQSGGIEVIRTSDGAALGSLRLEHYAMDIVSISTPGR